MQTDLNSIVKENLVDTIAAHNAMTIQGGKLPAATAGSLFLEESMLFFAREGSVDFSYGDSIHRVEKHQVAFFKRDAVIEYRSNNEPCCFMLFVLTKEVIVEFTRLAQLSMPGGITSEMLVVSNPSGSLLRYIASIQLYLQDGVSITDKLARIKLLELLLCLSADDHSILKEVLDIREQFRSKITGVVEENIMNSLTLRQLARLSGRSLSSFRRDFSSIYNMPPSRWIRLKRLEKALELLTNTNMTITDICYTLGFENVAHFSRIFKLQFHYPPSEIRLKCLAG